jgi:hypothetical protein
MGIDLTPPEVTIGRLRAWHSEWEWKAVRDGMGWAYIGTRGDRLIRVEARMGLEDEHHEWWVLELDVPVEFVMTSWQVKESTYSRPTESNT